MLKLPQKKIQSIYLLIPPVIAFFLFASSLKYYFFQDDFYELIISKATNLKEFINLFAFLENRSSYRPIGLQLYFFLSQTIFGLNPIFYRFVTFVLFFASYFLISKCVAKILDNKQAGLLTAFFWVTSSIHFLSLSWIAAAWIIIGTFFFFLSLYLLLSFLENNKMKFYVLSVLFFLICAGSFEFFLAFPFIFFVYLVSFRNLELKKAISIIAPYLLLISVYCTARLSLASLPQISEYKLEIGPEALKNLFWYFLWTLNIPEEFKKQITTNLIVFNKTFLLEFYVIIIKSFLSALLVLVITAICLGKKKLSTKHGNVRLLIFSLWWFAVGIAPVVFFPNHSFSMYLSLASVGVYMIIGHSLASLKSKLILSLVVIIWLFSSVSTLKFYRQTFWVEDSQAFAHRFSKEIKKQYPSVPNKAVIYFPLQDNRHRQAILNGDAVKVLYNDSTLKVFFDEQTLQTEVKLGKVNKENIIYFYEK